jgi:parallel beta-helix repeat protein
MMGRYIFWSSLIAFCIFVHPTLSQLREGPESLLKPHRAIFINTDEDFTPPDAERGCRCVTSGSGTPDDPYVIENLDMESTSFYGIRIRGTKAHFIIRNVKVAYEGSALFGGILLEGVENGGIEGVDITGATAYGISLKKSKNNKLIANSIANNKGTGIYLSRSAGNALRDNTVKVSGIFGIHLEVSDENVLSNNTVVENKKGGVFLRGFTNVLVGNTIKDNLEDGVDADMFRKSVLIGNTVCGNEKWGIHLRDSRDVVVDGNTICENGFGIYLERSQNNLVMNNIFTRNKGRGIYVEGQPPKNLVINNTIEDKPKEKAGSKETNEDSAGSSSSGEAK